MDIFWNDTMMQRTTNENALVMFIVYALIFCPHFFSETRSKPAKKYRGMFYYLIKKHMQKFRHLVQSCNKPFNWRLLCKKAYIPFWGDFHFLQELANFWQTDLFWHEKHCSTIEGLRAKRAYIEYWPIFIFCRIELSFGRLTCFDMESNIP